MAGRKWPRLLGLTLLGGMILIISWALLSVKVWGGRLLKEDSFRHELAVQGQGEIPVSQLGRANRSQDSLLAKTFGLTGDGTIEDKLHGSVDKDFFYPKKNESVLDQFLKWPIKKLLHNFGLENRDIQRSGQVGAFRLWIHYWLFPFRSVINLAWEPGNEYEREYLYEMQFCENRQIDYYRFQWSAGGLGDWSSVDDVLEIISNCKKPVWIHCEGGKDRTGGLLAIWQQETGYPTEVILQDFEKYGIPSRRWLQRLSVDPGSPHPPHAQP